MSKINLEKRRKRIFEIVEVGNDLDKVSRGYDFFNAFAIVLNIIVSVMYTYDSIRADYGDWLVVVEQFTVAFFTVDYALRVWTAKFLYPKKTKGKAVVKYMFSFNGIVDLLSFAPYYLPIMFPAGTIAFRMVRIVRIFRLFRINAYYDSLSVIIGVIKEKGQQLISSVFIILVLMIASSLCMYSLEHEAQPDVFENAFSGIWWATSTLLTVGYGDIYPITTLGRIFGMFISFLGVGIVAIPTGILSAGFVSEYTNLKREHEFGTEADMHFIKVKVESNDHWVGKRVANLDLPEGIIISVIKRDNDVIIPRGDIVLQTKDVLVLGAEPYENVEEINLKEMVLKANNPWIGVRIRNLDLSRQSVIVLVKRKNKSIIPNGDTLLLEGDRVYVYTQMFLSEATDIDI